MSFTINWIPTNATQAFATGVAGDFNNDTTVKNWQIVLPSSMGTWSFAAIVTKFSPKNPIDDLQTADITLKISGKPTLA